MASLSLSARSIHSKTHGVVGWEQNGVITWTDHRYAQLGDTLASIRRHCAVHSSSIALFWEPPRHPGDWETFVLILKVLSITALVVLAIAVVIAIVGVSCFLLLTGVLVVVHPLLFRVFAHPRMIRGQLKLCQYATLVGSVGGGSLFYASFNNDWIAYQMPLRAAGIVLAALPCVAWALGQLQLRLSRANPDRAQMGGVGLLNLFVGKRSALLNWPTYLQDSILIGGTLAMAWRTGTWLWIYLCGVTIISIAFSWYLTLEFSGRIPASLGRWLGDDGWS